MEYYYYPIDIAFQYFDGEQLMMVMRATPGEYLLVDREHDDSRQDPISKAAEKADARLFELLRNHYGDDVFEGVNRFLPTRRRNIGILTSMQSLVLQKVCQARNQDEEKVMECVEQFISRYEEISPEDGVGFD